MNILDVTLAKTHIALLLEESARYRRRRGRATR